MEKGTKNEFQNTILHIHHHNTHTKKKEKVKKRKPRVAIFEGVGGLFCAFQVQEMLKMRAEGLKVGIIEDADQKTRIWLNRNHP